MLSRRNFLRTVAAAAAVLPSAAMSEVRCTQPNFMGVRQCSVGVPGIRVRAAGQECIYWCWAACIQSVLAMHGCMIGDQRVVVRRLFGDMRCATATGEQIFHATRGHWQDDHGSRFWVEPNVLIDTDPNPFDPFGRPKVFNPQAIMIAANELAEGRPLITGALGHATVMTSMTYAGSAQTGVVIQEIIVRDPYVPLGHSAVRRQYSPQEAMNLMFLAAVRVRRI